MQKTRISKLRTFLSENNLDSFILHDTTGLRYFLGFTGSSGLALITDKTVLFITDFRYKNQSASEVIADEIVITDKPLFDSLLRIPAFNSCGRIGFEAGLLIYSHFQNLDQAAPEKLVPCEDVTASISSVKSFQEIEYIKRACDITVAVFDDIRPFFRDSVTEMDIAAEIAYKMRKLGSDGEAFDSIVLFGERTALTHGKPGTAQLKPGDFIQLDFGASYNGYCADFSRALIVGRPSREQREIHLAVKKAQENAIDTIKSGVPAKDVDLAARNCLEKRGFLQYFGHSVGHGVGLNVHTLPRLSKTSEALLEPGNVFTVEPGVYIQGIGGVRIEDTVSLDQTGVSILTEAERELFIIE